MIRNSLVLGFVGALALGCDGGGGGGNAGSGGAGGSAGSSGAAGTGGAAGAMACTEIGCEDGFTLSLKAANADFTAGEYTVTADIGGAMESCTISIGSMVDSTCNALFIMSNQIDILYGGTPASVGVVITRDGTEVHNQTYTPQYMEVQPNGEGCPPICKQASAEVTL